MTTTLSPGTAEEVGLCPRRIEGIRQHLKESVESGHTPAVSALVARRGKIVLQEAFGKRTPRLPEGSLTPDSIFPVASISKPVVAAAAMMLVEEGRLSLNRRLRDYVPEVQGDGTDEILVHHLRSEEHTSEL